MEELANRLLDEDWTYVLEQNQESESEEYGILYRYLVHMYEKVKADRLVITSKKADDNNQLWMYWHTGLFDKDYEDIIFVAQRYENYSSDIFYFSRFEKASVIAKYTEIPKRADFFEKRERLVFNPNYKIDYNVKHLLSDNIDRFPDFFKEMEGTLQEYILSGAVEHATKRVYANFTEAAPSYYDKHICFLLPLYLKDKNAELPDLVLAISENGTDRYYGYTCLTLAMAYNDARLICRPLQHWIRPKKRSSSNN